MLKVWILAVAIAVSSFTPASAGTRHEKCRYQGVEKGRWTVHEVRWTIRCAADHFGVSASTAFYIADRESNYRWSATNPSSGACGIFQHLPRYWSGRVDTLRRGHPRMAPYRDSCYNARTNILTAMHMVLHGGWGAWGM